MLVTTKDAAAFLEASRPLYADNCAPTVLAIVQDLVKPPVAQKTVAASELPAKLRVNFPALLPILAVNSKRLLQQKNGIRSREN
jgi:hypothetical protein